jgi:hypothetical protein
MPKSHSGEKRTRSRSHSGKKQHDLDILKRAMGMVPAKKDESIEKRVKTTLKNIEARYKLLEQELEQQGKLRGGKRRRTRRRRRH